MTSHTKHYSLLDAKMPPAIGPTDRWQLLHTLAVRTPVGTEIPIIGLINAWTDYANQHRARFESGIGDDYVLGPEWVQIGLAIRGLLNGDCGRLDCGVIDGFILDTLTAEGYDETGQRA